MWKVVLAIIFFPCTLHAFWPVYWEFGGEKRFFGPLASYQHEDNRTHLTIRPFLFSYDSDDGGVYDYIYPLGRSAKDKSYFVPFYLSKDSPQPAGPSPSESDSSRSSDTSFLFFFQGTSPKGSYGGLFPFYGKLYDRFGKDEMGFALWPLYGYSEAEGATKSNFLWPFFSVYGKAEKGFKFWPLFGTRERPGIKKSSFFLWPVFYKEESGLDTDEPLEKFYAIPFYLSSKSKTRDEYAIMFPLYLYSKDAYKEKRIILWPLFSSVKGEDVSGYSIFPLVASDKRENYKSFSILWPLLYNESEWYIKDRRYTKKRVLLINRHMEDEDGLFYNIWPLFEHQEKQGGTDILMPSIFPFRLSGFDRIIKPLFTLMEYREMGTMTMTSFLYGLYTKEEDGDNWKVRFAFLFELKKESGSKGFDVLSGLFGMDRSRIKILYIPFKRNSPDPDTKTSE
jgi:hypothetical protein